MKHKMAMGLCARINKALKGKRPSVAIVVKDENHSFNWIIEIRNSETLMREHEQKQAFLRNE